MDLAKNLLGLIPSLGENFILLILLAVVSLVAGFYGLVKGADIFVGGASKIAEKARIPLIVIGLTIVAFGTSAPEAAVSITSAVQDSAGIAIGNVIGSNIMNLLLILGISALIAKLPVQKNTIKFEVPFLLVITGVLIVLGIMGAQLSRIDGLIFVLLFALFFVYLFRISKSPDTPAADDVPTLTASDTMPKMIFAIVFGLALIVVGSDFAVYGASTIASAVGISDRVIGLTIVAIGTSLPELVTSIKACRMGKPDLAVGNVIGSNIFNILFVLGLSALIAPSGIDFSSQFVTDGLISVGATVLFGILIWKKRVFTRLGGAIFTGLYVVYTASIFIIN